MKTRLECELLGFEATYGMSVETLRRLIQHGHIRETDVWTRWLLLAKVSNRENKKASPS